MLIRRDEQEAAPAYAREKSVLSTLQPNESSTRASYCEERKKGVCFDLRAVALRQRHPVCLRYRKRYTGTMAGLKQEYGPRNTLTGLKRSVGVFFSQAGSFNGCDKKRLRATRTEAPQTTFPQAFDLFVSHRRNAKQDSRC